MVVERLDPHVIAGEDQFIRARIPDRESEHADETRGDTVAPRQVALQQDFRIAPRLEDMPERLQFLAQFDEIVDLAVEHETDLGAAFGDGEHGLRPAGEVDDRQATAPQADVPIQPHAACIRPALDEGVRHRLDHAVVRTDILFVTEPTGDTAHRITSP